MSHATGSHHGPESHHDAAAADAGPTGGPGGAILALLVGLVTTAVVLWTLLAPRLEAYPPPAPPPTTAYAASLPAAHGDAHAAPAAGHAEHGAEAGLGALVEKQLAGGAKVAVPEHGVEGRLLAFITDAHRPVDATTWFDFDRLTFETGSATLGAASQEQLTAVAAILAAYPAVKLKIGGYTDNVGEAAMNQKLSEARASSVQAALVKMGVAQARLAAEGYGEQHPVADNATAEGRARNRRISMRVTEK